MSNEKTADLVVIGGGIAGLSVAFNALSRGLKVILLDDGRLGTSYAATGFIAPRLDYMLKDIDLVELADRECLGWKLLFGKIMRPTRVLIPIKKGKAWESKKIQALIDSYDEITFIRKSLLPPSEKISRHNLSKLEPSLNTELYDEALSFWEFVVNPKELLNEFTGLLFSLGNFEKIIVKPETVNLKIDSANNTAYIYAEDSKGRGFVFGKSPEIRPPMIINATGPWMQDILASLGICMNIKYQLGVQLAVPGNFLNSTVITFDERGSYCVCMPRDGFTQVGPTNTAFNNHPDNINPNKQELDSLAKLFRSILKPGLIPAISGEGFLKAGLRVKPYFGDTNRPVVWNHAKNGVSNLISVHPGKMSLALKAADEVMSVVSNMFPPKPHIFMDGDDGKNRPKLKWLKTRSLCQSSSLCLKHMFKKQNTPQ